MLCSYKIVIAKSVSLYVSDHDNKINVLQSGIADHVRVGYTRLNIATLGRMHMEHLTETQ